MNDKPSTEKESTPVTGHVVEDIDEIAKYDPELRFRRLSGIALKLMYAMTLVLSIFHIYTAGFGVLQEWRHRTFHLAFVLPLVFFLYTMRKEKTEGKKFMIYDIIYAAIGSAFLTTMCRELFHLVPATVSILALISFGLFFYFKRREFLSEQIALYLDFPIFTAMILVLVYTFYLEFSDLHFLTWFKDLNPSLVFWGFFLLGIFLSILSLFVLQWINNVRTLFGSRTVRYNQDNIPYFDVFFALMASLVSIYIFLEFNNIGLRAGSPAEADLLIGAAAILFVLEGARRSIGAPLPFIATLVLVNCYLGPYFLKIPGLTLFAHRGYSVSRIIDYMYLGTEGIYGIPLGVVATFVFHFVLFGLFISRTGLGQLFMDLAMAVTGGTAGGPAKVAVVSSGLFGSISGSSVANTVTTGSFTIPLMKKVGYSPVFAGAVEATASTGGQIMPPVMGAAAFIMADFLGIPYIKIATCAIIPALLYYFAVGWMVHLEALKIGLLGLPREMLPRISTVLKERGLLVTPLIIIVYLLISGRSPFLAAFWGIILSVSMGQIHLRTICFLIPILLSIPGILFEINPLAYTLPVVLLWGGVFIGGLVVTFRYSHRIAWIASLAISAILAAQLLYGVGPYLSSFWTNMAIIGVGVFYKGSKMRVPEILSALEWGTKNAIAIGAACACVGFIVGGTTLTGLGLKFAATVINLAQGTASALIHLDLLHLLTMNGLTLFFTLFFTMIACFILGMGIPTTAQYIVASMIAAPALMQFGIHPLVSHMFVFYYAVLADVTPPVALAAYAASGISGADPFRTGLTAFRLSFAGMVVPYVFVAAPIMLWLPTILDGKTPFDYLWFFQVIVTSVLGIIALGATMIGYMKYNSTIPERIATGIAAAFLMLPETYTDFIGAFLLLAVFLLQRARKKKILGGGKDVSKVKWEVSNGKS
ncbi:MAG: TRAP transporter fused permease subunit [Deltaproteobacteria bacterium]|nr:TRAP transporter fused permease subunit [Deltaproteobacteria bacterium]